MNETRARIYPAIFLTVVTAGIGVLVLRVLAPFAAAIAWAVVLGVTFSGPWGRVERRFPRRRSLSALLLSTTIALCVLLPSIVLGIVVLNEAGRAATLLGDELRRREVSSVADVVRLPALSGPLDWLHARTGLGTAELTRRVADNLAALSAQIASLGGGLVKGFVSAALTFVMTMFFLFFYFRDGHEMTGALVNAIPLDDGKRWEIVRRLRAMLQAIFRGSLLCALAQGVTGAIGWTLAGLPSPVLAGAVMAFLSLLPVGGTAFVWGPGALWCWASGRPGAAVFLAIWGAVVTSFLADNVLKPLLIGSGSGDMGTLAVFVGVFGGIAAFGLLGLFLGPIVLALGRTILDVLRELARPPSPVAAHGAGAAAP